MSDRYSPIVDLAFDFPRQLVATLLVLMFTAFILELSHFSIKVCNEALGWSGKIVVGFDIQISKLVEFALLDIRIAYQVLQILFIKAVDCLVS